MKVEERVEKEGAAISWMAGRRLGRGGGVFEEVADWHFDERKEVWKEKEEN